MKKIYKNVLIAVILSFFLELCFFNFDSIRSKSYKPLDKQPDFYYETNFVENNGSYILGEKETFINYLQKHLQLKFLRIPLYNRRYYIHAHI